MNKLLSIVLQKFFFGTVVLYEIAVLFTLHLQHNVLNKPRSCSDLFESLGFVASFFLET